MYILVSDTNKIPKELDGFQVEVWSSQEFVDRASADDGLDIDEGLWYHTTCLVEDIYTALTAFIDAGVEIVFYHFDNEPDPSFPMNVNIQVCKDPNAAPSVEESVNSMIEEIENISPLNTEPTGGRPGSFATTEPAPEPEPEPEPEPIFSTPVSAPAPAPAPIPEPTPAPVMPAPVAPAPAPVMAPPVAPAPMASSAPVIPSAEAPKPKIKINGLNIAGTGNMSHADSALGNNVSRLLDDNNQIISKASEDPAKIILFGSSKGGTGKTFTACMCAYWFAKSHPGLRIALADFDIIDGQVAITTNQVTPTVQGFYKEFRQGKTTFEDLYKFHANNTKFSSNIDFYLAPAQDIPAIVEDNLFWRTIFTLLVKNYDVVFFDSGIDYMGKQPISQLYKIADKIILTSNTSINSVNSIIKQCLTLSGKRPNNIFSADDEILSKTDIVLTRVSDEYQDVNEQVVTSLSKYAPIIAAFGNIDSLIFRVQWGGAWELIDEDEDITDNLERITDLSEEE